MAFPGGEKIASWWLGFDLAQHLDGGQVGFEFRDGAANVLQVGAGQLRPQGPSGHRVGGGRVDAPVGARVNRVARRFVDVISEFADGGGERAQRGLDARNGCLGWLRIESG